MTHISPRSAAGHAAAALSLLLLTHALAGCHSTGSPAHPRTAPPARIGAPEEIVRQATITHEGLTFAFTTTARRQPRGWKLQVSTAVTASVPGVRWYDSKIYVREFHSRLGDLLWYSTRDEPECDEGEKQIPLVQGRPHPVGLWSWTVPTPHANERPAKPLAEMLSLGIRLCKMAGPGRRVVSGRQLLDVTLTVDRTGQAQLELDHSAALDPISGDWICDDGSRLLLTRKRSALSLERAAPKVLLDIVCKARRNAATRFALDCSPSVLGLTSAALRRAVQALACPVPISGKWLYNGKDRCLAGLARLPRGEVILERNVDPATAEVTLRFPAAGRTCRPKPSRS